jgi:type VI protein secretion system component Hcp
MASNFYVTIVAESQGTIEGPCQQAEREKTIMGYAFTGKVAMPWDPDEGHPIKLEDAYIVKMNTDLEDTGQKTSGQSQGIEERLELTFNRITWTWVEGNVSTTIEWRK